MKPKVDVNCDLGESYGAFKIGNDTSIMPYITSANIACGFHAGDPMVAAHTINLAKKLNVAVGAHPGLPDLLGFGRREMQLTSEENKNYTIYQVSAIQGLAKAVGLSLQHVKPHGALYNMAMKDKKVAKAIVEAVKALRDDLVIFASPKSELAQAATSNGLRVAYEFFADRAYNPDGSLVSRQHANAVIQEPRKVVERTVKAITDGTVFATNGKLLRIGEVHTICLHGDTLAATKLASALRTGLTEANVQVEPIGNFI